MLIDKRFYAMIILITLLFMCPSTTEAVENQQNVLILNSYHKGFTWSDDQTQGMIQTVRGIGMDPIFHVEYMDWKFNPTRENLQLRYEQYKQRYTGQKIDLLMTTDDAALAFALKHRAELFSNAPIVHTGISPGSPNIPTAQERDVTGVHERVDSEGTIQMMYRLNPDLRRIYLVYDNTESGLQSAELMKAAAYKVNPSFELVHLNTFTFTDIIKLLSDLPEGDNSAVLINTYSRDVEGTAMEMERFVKIFSENSHIPTYILYDFDSGYGAVGGSLIGGWRQGEAAAKLAARILSGERASTIPVVEGTEPSVIVDHKQLERFKIPVNRLSPGATMLNCPTSFYEKNKTVVLTTGGIMLLMTAFIISLMMNVKRRRVAEEGLKKSNLELALFSEEIQAQYNELERTQEALGESEEKYRSLINNINIGVYRNSANSEVGFIQVNPALVKILGYDSEVELLGISVADLYQKPEDRKRFIEELRRNGFVKDKELGFQKKDGTPIWCSVTTTAQYDEQGSIQWLDGVIEDITERKRAEDALQQAYDELEHKVEERTQQLTALNQELTVINTEYVLLNEELHKTNQELQNEIAERKRTEEELARNNQELKTAQSQIIQQEKMASIGQLAAGVAHEINNPTGFIISNLESLKKYTDRLAKFIAAQETALNVMAKAKEDGNTETINALMVSLKEDKRSMKIDYIITDTEDLLRETQEGASRIKNIVQDMKGFARMANERQLADINAGIESTINIIWNEIKYKATLKKELGDIPFTVCNQGQLNQVFMNLLINAVHAIDDQGEITIKTWAEADKIFVSIADTGKGIPPEIMNRIFEPFFTTKEVGKGTGLGLSVSYDIIKKHDGEIRVESEVGKGTVFTITIPVTGVETA